MLSYYKVRIDTNDRTRTTNFLDKYSDCYLISFENQETDNPHCHGYLETTTKQATIRNAIRKQYGGGNGSYSLKSLDEERPLEYLAYIIKEGDYVNSGIPEETLAKAKEHDALVKTQMKEKAKQRRTTLEVLQEELASDLVVQQDESYIRYKERILMAVIHWYKKKGTLIRQFMIVSQVQTLLLKHHPDGDMHLSCQIIDRI